jgi:hypothetical protein
MSSRRGREPDCSFGVSRAALKLDPAEMAALVAAAIAPTVG